MNPLIHSIWMDRDHIYMRKVDEKDSMEGTWSKYLDVQQEAGA
jgi:hypothetical protein